MPCHDKRKRDNRDNVSLGLADASGSRQQQCGVESTSKQFHGIFLFTPASPDGAVGRALNSLGSSRQVKRGTPELESWSTNPNSRHTRARTGRVAYLLVFFYPDSASRTIFVSRRAAIWPGGLSA
jgi:hypothetical protein